MGHHGIHIPENIVDAIAYRDCFREGGALFQYFAKILTLGVDLLNLRGNCLLSIVMKTKGIDDKGRLENRVAEDS